ncbi:MAG: MFS transporter, partial [Elainella sp.]
MPLAQVLTPDSVETPEAASVLFSGPQFFIALVSGILLAFAIQLLLTNFSVAAGISYLGKSSGDDHSDDREGGLSIRKITLGVGIWTLISVSIALFFACYLAVQLSLLTTPRLGAIISLVIWAAYFSLLVWVSSTTVGSLIGSVVQTATSGFQAIAGTATAALGGRAAKNQMVSTAEAMVAAVRNELGTGLDGDSLRQSLEDYVGKLRRPGLDMNSIRGDLKALLNDPELIALAESGELRHLDRQAFVSLIRQRTDLSKQEVERLADLLESVWAETTGRKSNDGMTELVDYLRSTQTGQLKIDELNAKVDRFLASSSNGHGKGKGDGNGTNGSSNGNGGQPSGMSQTGMSQTIQSGVTTLVGMLAGRSDLSDLNLQQIVSRIQSASAQVKDQAQTLTGTKPAVEYSPIQTDVEDYLRHTYSWQMGRDRLDREFRELLYDPQADPATVVMALSRLQRQRFVEILSERGVFTQSRLQELADQLEAIRREVLATAEADAERELAADLQQRVKSYLAYTPKAELLAGATAFPSILSDSEASFAQLQQRLAPYNRDFLWQELQQRQDLDLAEQTTVLNSLEQSRDRVLREAESTNQQASQRYEAFQQGLGDFLRTTSKADFSPESIRQGFQSLMQDPATAMAVLRHQAGHFDRNTWVQLLSQRQDLSPAEAEQIVNQVEANWQALVHAPNRAISQVNEQASHTVETLKDYLRRTNLAELDPDGIQRDLQQLFANPQEGAAALRRRLSQIDRETLVRLLAQRPDLSEDQANRTIDQVLGSVQSLIRSPRRLALRSQQKAVSFEQELEAYLRNTDKAALDPDGIKRDFRLLLHSPKLGAQNLADRLSQLDRSTVIALLSQRPDITPEEADRIVANIESVRDQTLGQVQQIQA